MAIETTQPEWEFSLLLYRIRKLERFYLVIKCCNSQDNYLLRLSLMSSCIISVQIGRECEVSLLPAVCAHQRSCLQKSSTKTRKRTLNSLKSRAMHPPKSRQPNHETISAQIGVKLLFFPQLTHTNPCHFFCATQTRKRTIN